MYDILLTAMIIVGALIIIAVMMQPSKQQDALSALSGGGGGDLFATQKARGFVAVMQRITTVLAAIWFILGLALVYLSSH
ncbi:MULTISPECIES: preprotein translocase subunit SecG [Weissella]|jgi:preprotein translocase subunit SecG|uniref:Protein-export membrane protein SecG n=1 Tax=Weissella hellenica TaxID=46256 RepID=A0A4Y4G5W0_WEIHE|nr:MULTISPECIES: preprotein translocase subunit SecG [Weissella]KAA8435099.1 preprotein translocase subunit SecG [Weissella paramesenteroides]KAA8438990.1 preprotein translocase subunit SecG [Weissella paramesenteroides]MBU7568598.1 preprotein translocase subunit SecG [Weissella hellenica]NKY67122.1 preprotein translocase subunit SecG [Weissella hellenica]QDJ58410.1 preprotein translocase subunit SecG [Weissella hellenica]